MMQLVRVPKAAQQMGISKQYLWKLIDAKVIPSVEIDGVHYVDMDTASYKPKHDYKAGGRPKRK